MFHGSWYENWKTILNQFQVRQLMILPMNHIQYKICHFIELFLMVIQFKEKSTFLNHFKIANFHLKNRENVQLVREKFSHAIRFILFVNVIERAKP